MDHPLTPMEAARLLSKSSGKPVLVTLLAPQDCGDTQAFLPTLARVKQAFGDALISMELNGSHKNREANAEDVKAALTHFQYDRVPGDSGGNQRGHFPSGALYVNGEEVYRLPSDSVLSEMPPQALAEAIANAAHIAYDSKVLFARGDRSPDGR